MSYKKPFSKKHDEAPAEPVTDEAPAEPVTDEVIPAIFIPAIFKPRHEFAKIGGTKIYKCIRCGFQTMSAAADDPFSGACFVAPVAQPVKTP
jgi:hypothetical protein